MHREEYTVDDPADVLFGPWMLLGPLLFLLFIVFTMRWLSWRRIGRALKASDVPALGLAALAVLMSSEPRWVELYQVDFIFVVAAFLSWIAAAVVVSRTDGYLSPTDR